MDNEKNLAAEDSQLVQPTTESDQESLAALYVDNHKMSKYSNKALLAALIIIFLSIVCHACFKLLGTSTGLSGFSIAEKYDRIINSSSSREEAKQAVIIEFNDKSYNISNTVTKSEIIEETEDYYGLDVSWDYEDDNQNQTNTYNEKVISFKKSTYDYESIFSHSTGETILTDRIITKDKNKIKTILDTIHKIENKQNGSFEWISSQLNEDATEYTYELKYQETVFSDWGMDDEVSTIIITQSIDKSTGEISKPETIKE